ncbi:acyltransferase [Roseomonas genomospecies 6]|nr:acyltransferase [Roseomonas genomospecies 6]
MTAAAGAPPGNRFYSVELESLRGLAAIAVVLAHASAIFSVDGISAYWGVPLSSQPPSTLVLSLIGALFNPGTAVVFFFVLSGYVLTRSLADAPLAFGKYLVRRAFRLFPPMWASILLMWALLAIGGPPADKTVFSDWFNAVFSAGIGLRDVAENVVLAAFKANPVTWTMYVEAIGSLFIPFSLLVSRYFDGRHLGSASRYALLLVTLALSMAAFPSLSLSYVVCFQVGAVLAQNRSLVIVRHQGAVILAAIAAMVCERLFIPSERWSLLVNIAVSAAVMLVVLGRAETGFLRHGAMRFVGLVSYSLYLFHPPVIYVAATAAAALGLGGHGVWPSLGLLVVVVALSLVLAAVAHRLVEAPTRRAGRHLTAGG